MHKVKILLLEDDELFCSSLVDFLECEDFYVEFTNSSEEFLQICFNKNFDIYLLDINVPKLNGLDLLKILRDSNDMTPSIFLTSYNDKQTLKDGFKNGTDDFLVKPFDEDELILRIKSLIKRSSNIFKNININGVIYDINLKIFIKNNKSINVPKKIILLFELFYKNKNKIISKDEIINKLWSSSQEYSEASLRVYISKLKDIIGKDSITNIKGLGYKIQF